MKKLNNFCAVMVTATVLTVHTGLAQTNNIPKYTTLGTFQASQVYDIGSSVIIGASTPYSSGDFVSIPRTWGGSTALRMANTHNVGYVNFIATAQSSGMGMSAYGPMYSSSGMFEANGAVLNGSGTTMNIGTPGSTPLTFWTSNVKRMTIDVSGKVLIGAKKQDNMAGNHNTAILQVNGDIVVGNTTSANLWVTQNNWADFVFEKNYKLMPLKDLEQYYQTQHHLPNIPTTKDIQTNGNNLGQTDALLLQKIEELTLYIVELQKEVDALKAKGK